LGESQKVFVTGGTGYVGQRLIAQLLQRGHSVSAVVRAQSQSKLPIGCTAINGNALDHTSFVEQVRGSRTFVQLAGVAHPSPAKAQQFREIDLVAGMEGITAAVKAGVQHFVYVSVAHPAPMMKAYIEVRSQCEARLLQSGLNATVLRPWYVLGPGHRWPYLLIPIYWLAEQLPATREGARRLGLVTLTQMVDALQCAIENPCHGIRILEVPEIRNAQTEVASETVPA